MKTKTCKHEPDHARPARFADVCKHCKVEIEPVDCPVCEGTGCQEDPVDDCPKCKGTGAKRWRKV